MKFILLITRTMLTKCLVSFVSTPTKPSVTTSNDRLLVQWSFVKIHSIISVFTSTSSQRRGYGTSALHKTSVIERWRYRSDTRTKLTKPVPNINSVIDDVASITPNRIHYHDSKTWICNAPSIIEHYVKCASKASHNIQFDSSNCHVKSAMIKICPIWFGRAIEEILHNAIKHNAIKHNEAQTGLIIEVITHISGDEFVVTICDNGVGISDNVTRVLSCPGNRNVKSIQTKLNAPMNLYNIESLLWQVHGSLQVSSARKFLTKITIKVPLVKPASLHAIKTTGSRVIDHKLEQNNFSSTSTITVNRGDAKELLNTDDNATKVKEYIAEYKLDKPWLCEINDRDASKFVQKFNQILRRHYNEESFNKAIATKLMLTTDKTLTRRLNTHYKLGFVDILRKYRLHRASQLLLEQESVTSVAFNTGFSSPSYFTRCFKLEFGFLPSRLAKPTSVQARKE